MESQSHTQPASVALVQQGWLGSAPFSGSCDLTSRVKAPLRFGPAAPLPWWKRAGPAKFDWVVLWSHVPGRNTINTNRGQVKPEVTDPGVEGWAQPLWYAWCTYLVLIALMCILHILRKNYLVSQIFFFKHKLFTGSWQAIKVYTWVLSPKR